MATLMLSLAEYWKLWEKGVLFASTAIQSNLKKAALCIPELRHLIPPSCRWKMILFKKSPTTAPNRLAKTVLQLYFLSLHTPILCFWQTTVEKSKSFKVRRAQSWDMALTKGASNCKAPHSAAVSIFLQWQLKDRQTVLSWDTPAHSWSSLEKVWLDLIPLNVTQLRLQVRCYGPLDCRGESTLGQGAASVPFDDMSDTIIFVTSYHRPEEL